MIAMKRDRTGILARLECDRCHRKGIIFLVGHAPMSKASHLAQTRRWLRDNSRGTGWTQLPRVVDGHPIEIDLCRACTARVAHHL